MKVLLTGASGFVGSHILDLLVARRLPTAILLRPASPRRFIEQHLPRIEVRPGSITDAGSLESALNGITHVIHAAGCTKAVRPADYHAVNAAGTANLIEAVNRHLDSTQRVVFISSLAASRPGTSANPAREDEPSGPVTAYGHSKLASEQAVQDKCRADFVILRPSAVYGPRDSDFLVLFKTVRRRIVPCLNGGRQELSLVYVEDLAEVVVESLAHSALSRQKFNVSAAEILTSAGMAREIGRQLGVKPFELPAPRALLWIACAARTLLSKMTGQPNILSLDKYPELVAPGWVCDTSKLRGALGRPCPTQLSAGITRTLAWYRHEGWL